MKKAYIVPVIDLEEFEEDLMDVFAASRGISYVDQTEQNNGLPDTNDNWEDDIWKGEGNPDDLIE